MTTAAHEVKKRVVQWQDEVIEKGELEEQIVEKMFLSVIFFLQHLSSSCESKK
jgi:hypothetical protein